MQTQTIRPGSVTIQRSSDRKFYDHGWLKTYHSFSFADYFDPANVHWGALRVLNDDVIAPGRGFGTHPHRDMEILTYVLKGELEHKDSMGNIGVVRPGGVQYLSAGTGIRHSEYNHSQTQPVRLVQMWVVPNAEGLPPRYGQVDFTAEDRRNRWLTIASGRAGSEAKIAIWQDAECAVARLEDSTLRYELGDARYGFLFVAGGSIEFDGERLGNGDSARILGPRTIELRGAGEVLLWDTPAAGTAVL